MAGIRGQGSYSINIGSSNDSFYGSAANGDFAIAIGGGISGASGAVANGVLAIAIGTGANSVGTRSTAVGAFAGGSAHDGSSYNSAFGDEAGFNINGAGNTAVGVSAGYNVTGDFNLASGNAAGQNVSGGSNTADGTAAGASVTGDNNSAFGRDAGSTVNGSSNVAVGHFAGNGVTGDFNTTIGHNSGFGVQGTLNTAYGDTAGRSVTGDYNIAVGYQAGFAITASRTIAIGAGAAGQRNGAVALGDQAVATKPQAVAIGASSVANVANTVSVGAARRPRRIMNVDNAVDPYDAVNFRQVKALIAAAASPPQVSARLPLILGATAERTLLTSRNPTGSDRRTARAGSDPAHDAGAPAAGNPTGDRPNGTAKRAGAGFASSEIVGWANIDRNGTPSEARNIANTTRRGAGEYEIAFQQALQHCTYHATLADFGFVSVKPGPQPESLKVQTRNHYGVLTDADFSLLVVC